MKERSYIFSLFFVWLFAVLHIQPLFISYEIEKEQIAETSCSIKKSCGQQKECDEEEKECASWGCNPFVPCAIGICCYVVENFYTPANLFTSKKQMLPLIDDDTLRSIAGECWHPPELVS